MYLGEIVRRVLVKLAQEAALFGKSIPKKLMTPFQLRYKFIVFNIDYELKISEN